MAFYASDPARAEALHSLYEEIHAQHQGKHWHALVDLAFDEGSPRWPLAEAPSIVYEGGQWSALRSVSPAICPLPAHNATALRDRLSRLNRYVAGRPMLAFVRSELAATDLAKAMRDVVEVETADGQAFMLRWADTRVSPTLARALQPAHWARICAHFEDWHVIDRTGAPAKLPPRSLPADLTDHKPTTRIRLTDAELNSLLTLGEPDALINQLSEQFGELLPTHNFSALHTEVAQVCSLARECGIESMAERFCLVVANRQAEGRLTGNERLRKWLAASAWAPGQFADALADFMETIE